MCTAYQRCTNIPPPLCAQPQARNGPRRRIVWALSMILFLVRQLTRFLGITFVNNDRTTVSTTHSHHHHHPFDNYPLPLVYRHPLITTMTTHHPHSTTTTTHILHPSHNPHNN